MLNSNKGDKILRNKLHKDNKNSMKKTLKSLLKSMYHTCARTHTHTHALEQMGDLTVFGQGDNTIKMSVFTNYKFNMIDLHPAPHLPYQLNLKSQAALLILPLLYKYTLSRKTLLQSFFFFFFFGSGTHPSLAMVEQELN